MANPFARETRNGTVAGVAVTALAVPFRRIRELAQAEAAHDDTALLLAMAAVVAESVRLEDGTPVEVDDLDAQTIAQLFRFATGHAPADPTSGASPDGAAPTKPGATSTP